MKAMLIAVALSLPTGTLLRAAEPKQHPDILTIANNGQEIHLPALLATNKVTIVDFHADWCGPCKAMAPYLESLARQDEKVQLIKVDIQSFESPVARQFSLTSIPNLRVFGPDGEQVGKDVSSFGTVKLYVKKAKRRLER